MSYQWRVVRLSKGQLLDVRHDDVLEDGLYRKCNTYRGGGGYDQFPSYYGSLYSDVTSVADQFLVQLHGCHLDCHYCYVTRAGVWGEPVNRTSAQLVEAFERSKQRTFHLMGGSPALYLDHWPELLDAYKPSLLRAFHSDLLLTEQSYDPAVLRDISRRYCLYAVDIKGLTPEEHLQSTRKPLRESLLNENLARVREAHVPFYVTFTGVNRRCAKEWIDAHGLSGVEWFVIDLINYKATPHVDDVPWGPQRRW